ncbi:MAG: AAA family ATPase [Lachnospiraceae bacterium]|nr:AAA family ATPase [Lachnospiraceae bacterium]
MYLERFVLPIDKEDDLILKRMAHNGGMYGYIDNIYPCKLFSKKLLSEVNFDRITIFYGGNGSGKSTLLNLIASKLELNRIAPYNSSELYDAYVYNCKYETGYDEEGLKYKIPNGSRIITSDDVFDYMLTVRTNNTDIAENIEVARDEWVRLRFGQTIKLDALEDYEDYRTQMLARQKSVSRRKFIRNIVGKEVKLNSNGETALEYFDSKIKNDTLYCLDEPENSLSPRLQIQLVDMLERMARYCGCQFIIATHSPFLLSLPGARIYDLDETPVDIKNWWELENPRMYFEFFEKYRHLFE